MNIAIIILLSLVSYLLGSFPSGYVLTKLVKKIDITTYGSKNTGATNTTRILGKGFGILALLLDVLKGVIVILILSIFKLEQFYIVGGYNIIAMYGIFAVLGHVFSIYLGFRGGKAVATSLGVLTFINPWMGLLVTVVFVIVAFSSKFVSLGSIMAATTAIITSSVFYFINPKMVTLENYISVLIMATIIITRHHQNIRRLLKGTENKIGHKPE